ncbi:MAG TPA: extracellular solute-binding protein [Candidatus Limnocylindrales bacterium]
MLDRRLKSLLGVVLVGALALQGCSSAASTASPSTAQGSQAAGSQAPGTPAPLEPATLTLWHNYGTEANATATQNLVKAFEDLHPGVKINIVSQPADNYFDLLQAAAISKTGPDLATMWTGLFALKYKSYLQPLNDLVPMTDLKKLKGIEYSSVNFNPDNGVLVVPLEVQFYNGFYNKKLFQQAGLDPNNFPTTWTDFFAACKKLKDAGIEPMVYGTGGQALGGGFYPWYDVSYLMMFLQPQDWKKLYDGELAWNDPTIKAQFDKWVSIETQGYANKDVLTNQDSIAQFEAGKAAMTMEGTWQIAEFQQKLGDDVGVFVPPFSDSPIKGVVEYSGDGFSMTTYSQHKTQAAAFLAFLASDAAQKIVADSGLIPAKEGFSSDQRMAKDLLSFAADKGYTRYPMIDNVIQPEVSDPVGTKILNAAFAGTMTVEAALTNLKQALEQLPADRRGSEYK